MVKETKFYDALGVSPDANDEDIRRAYRRLAFKFHPDKNKEPSAKEKFREISVAYDALSDPEKRKRYDQFGEKGMEAGADPSDIFSSFFGGSSRRGEPKPKDIVHELPVPLEHFYNGKTVKLAINRDRFCETCKGSGSNKPGVDAKCKDCSGRGVQVVTRQLGPGFIQQMQVPCRNCNGKGSCLKVEDRCKQCNGEQVIKDKKIFEINVEKGMKRGDHVTFRGEGDQIPGIQLAGDIIIILDQKPHERFTRKGNHLYMEHTISLSEALTGFTLNVTHLDGRLLAVRPPANTCVDPSKLWSIDREGMPVAGTGGSERGSLVINFKVQFPQSLSDGDSQQLRRLLGVPTQPTIPPDCEEAILQPTTVDLNAKESRRGRDDDSDEDSRGPKAATCAQQ